MSDGYLQSKVRDNKELIDSLMLEQKQLRLLGDQIIKKIDEVDKRVRMMEESDEQARMETIFEKTEEYLSMKLDKEFKKAMGRVDKKIRKERVLLLDNFAKDMEEAMIISLQQLVDFFGKYLFKIQQILNDNGIDDKLGSQITIFELRGQNLLVVDFTKQKAIAYRGDDVTKYLKENKKRIKDSIRRDIGVKGDYRINKELSHNIKSLGSYLKKA